MPAVIDACILKQVSQSISSISILPCIQQISLRNPVRFDESSDDDSSDDSCPHGSDADFFWDECFWTYVKKTRTQSVAPSPYLVVSNGDRI